MNSVAGNVELVGLRVDLLGLVVCDEVDLVGCTAGELGSVLTLVHSMALDLELSQMVSLFGLVMVIARARAARVRMLMNDCIFAVFVLENRGNLARSAF